MALHPNPKKGRDKDMACKPKKKPAKKSTGKKPCQMYAVGDKVYVYMFDLKKSIKNNGISEHRLGTITKVASVDIVGKDYKAIKCSIETISKKTMEVSNYASVLQIAKLDELSKAIKELMESEEVSEEKGNRLLEIIDI